MEYINSPMLDAGEAAQPPPENDTISVSTAFPPNPSLNFPSPDLILTSFDLVHFYISSKRLLSASHNNFNGLIAAQSQVSSTSTTTTTPIVSLVPESAAVLNLILHAVYDIYPASAATFHDLEAATLALTRYGLPLDTFLRPSRPLHKLLVAHAAVHPLDIYTLAAYLADEDLAVMASAYTLRLNLLSVITDEHVEKMGVAYFRRLFQLHTERVKVLKGLLLVPPELHGVTETCDFQKQGEVTRAWAFAVGRLAWEATPDISNQKLAESLDCTLQKRSCELCQKRLEEKIRNIIVTWSLQKRTI